MSLRNYTRWDYQQGWEHLGFLSAPDDPIALANSFEASCFGDRDGDGLRFWITPLYLLGDDMDNAIRSIERHQEACSDQPLSAAPEWLGAAMLAYVKLSQHRNRSSVHSPQAQFLRRLHAANPYVAPLILGEPILDKSFKGNSNHTQYEYAISFPDWWYRLWSDSDKQWLREETNTLFHQHFKATWAAFHQELSHLSVGAKRTELVCQMHYYLGLMGSNKMEDRLSPLLAVSRP